jgi:hypothetical protein
VRSLKALSFVKPVAPVSLPESNEVPIVSLDIKLTHARRSRLQGAELRRAVAA